MNFLVSTSVVWISLISQTLAQTSSIIIDASSTSTMASARPTALVLDSSDDDDSHYAFTRPKMDEKERIELSWIMLSIFGVGIGIGIITLISYVLYRRHILKAEEMKDMKEDPETAVPVVSRVPAPARKNMAPPPYPSPPPSKSDLGFQKVRFEQPSSSQRYSKFQTSHDTRKPVTVAPSALRRSLSSSSSSSSLA